MSMFDRQSILLILATILFLVVHQWVLRPVLFPPQPQTQMPAGVPSPGGMPESPLAGTAGGGSTPVAPASGETDEAGTDTESLPSMTTESGGAGGAEGEAPAASMVDIPLREDLVLELPAQPDGTSPPTARLRAVFTNLGAALRTLEILDHLKSARERVPLPLVQEFQPHQPSLELDERDRKVNLATRLYEVEDAKGGDPRHPVLGFRAVIPDQNLRVRKVYGLEEGQRHLKLRIEITNLGGPERALKLQLRAAAGILPEMPVCGSWDAATSPADINTNGLIGRRKPNGSIALDRRTISSVLNKPELHEGDPCVFTGCENRYFAAILIAPEKPTDWTRSVVLESLGANNIMGSLQSSEIRLSAGQTVSYDFVFYAGPKTEDALAGYSTLSGIHDFGWFDAIARPLLWLLHVFYHVTQYLGGYGLAIMLLTFLVRLGLHPLSRKAQISMHRMSKLNPEMKKLRDKYADDKQRLNQEMMKMYQENKVSPLGGCLPILLQIPIFIALYRVLQYSIDLRGTPFLWMKDLSQPDAAICFSVGLFGIQSLNILPILMTGLWVYQQMVAPKSEDPEQAQIQKVMMIMPVIFGFLFYSMPSGLVLYFVVSSSLGLLESHLIKKSIQAEEAGGPKPTGQLVFKKKKKRE